MNIWLIKIGEPLPLEENIKKMRTAFLAEKLTERGHSVIWWTSAFDHFKKRWVFKKDTDLKINEGLRIIALKGLGYKRNISFSRYIDHRIIASKFRKLAKKIQRPDIVIVSTPPYDLACEAVKFGKRNNITTIVDIRDPWPDIFLKHIPEIFKKIFQALLYKDFQMVKKTMRMADGIVAVTKTFLDWGLRYADRKKTLNDKVFHLGYKDDSNNYGKSETNKISNVIDKIKNKFVVTFIGTFAHYHNPAILIDCAIKLRENNIQFVLAGQGEFFSEIKEKSSLLNNVILPGWLNQDEIRTLLKHSNVGVCPTTQEIDLFPNKAFAYLSAGLPVISAFQGDLKEVIEKYQNGFYYPPNDVNVLVKWIEKLYNDTVLYKKMSENALKVFNEKFDADKIYEEYAGHIERIAHNYKQEQRKIKKDKVYKKHE